MFDEKSTTLRLAEMDIAAVNVSACAAAAPIALAPTLFS
jgi:hypothetical protein